MTESLERLRRAQSIGFLFMGGASRCAFQVGVVEALLALGIAPAACLGVSGGAWNAAAVAVGNAHRLRAYWRFFCRMPAFDLRNLRREHTPFAWRRIHERAFRRYVGAAPLRAPGTIPVYVALTRLRDGESVILDLRTAEDPFEAILASNYLPPFFTHPPVIDGEKYGDGGFSNHAPYEFLLEHGCDAVVILAQKGECEGGIFRSVADPYHVVPPEYADRVVVIRPRHRLDVPFTERRWKHLERFADLGARRTREILLGEPPAEDPECHHSHSPSWYAFRALSAARALRAS